MKNFDELSNLSSVICSPARKDKSLRLHIGFLMFLIMTALPGVLKAQQIALDLKNRPLSEVIKSIEDQSRYSFFHNDDIDTSVRINATVSSSDINKVLEAVFTGTGITYRISGRRIVLSRQPKPQPRAAVDTDDDPLKQVTLSGRVMSAETGQPVLGAAVAIPGTQYGSSTDAEGNFSFSARVNSQTVIQVSFIGMRTQEIKLGGRTQFVINLEDNTAQIDELVVTGFQNIRKTTFTGAATKIMADDVKVAGIVDASRMIEGQVAGVTIQNVSGTFGSAPKVRIRGATSINGENKPLWVIDGVVHDDIVNVSNEELTSGDPTTLLGSAVAGLNGNDIESIDVLKDASAISLYGARAMNGVIVVTTRRGSISEKPTIRYSGKFSVQLKPSYGNYDIMNSAEQMSVYSELDRKGFLDDGILNRSNWGVYGKMYNLIHTYDASSGKFLLENSAKARETFLLRYAQANTNWFDVLFRNSLQQEHSVSISSGTEKSRLYGSLSFLNDDGWTLADRVNRYTANLRQDVTLGKFNLGYQILGSVRDQKAPGSGSRVQNTVRGEYQRGFDINPFSYALNTSRALTVYDENGDLEYFQRNYAPFNILNEIAKNKIELKVVDIKMQLEASYRLHDKIKWDLLASYRRVKSDQEHKIMEGSNMAEAYRAAGSETIRSNNDHLYKDPDYPGDSPVVVMPKGGLYNRKEYLLTSYDIRNNFNFNHSFGEHNINLLIGQQIRGSNRQDFSNTGYGYQYNAGGTVFLDYHLMKKMIEKNAPYYSMKTSTDRFAAFYAKVDYDYEQRYVFSANCRYDGSNSLGKSRSARWLPTWGVSGKWNAHMEPFLSEVRWLSYASVRGSYGLVATMPPAANASAIFMNAIPYRYDQVESVIELESLANNELTWEKSYMGNIGVDIGFVNTRVELNLDLWQRKSFDLISSYDVSGIGGFISKTANYADMDSKGIDVSIGLVPVLFKDFRWRINFTMGYSKNIITNSKNLPTINNMIKAAGGKLEGYPVNSLFSIQFAGLDDYGVPLFINQTGAIRNSVTMTSTLIDNLKYEGPVDPRLTGGLSNTFSYKDLSLEVFFTYQAGNRIRLTPAFKSSYSDLDALPRKFHDRWMSPADKTNIPSIVDAYEKSRYGSIYSYNHYNNSTEMVAKGSFVRLKTLSLSYRVPKKIIQSIGFVENITFTAAGSNLFMIYQDKRLNGQDPEFYNSGGVAQPLQKQIIFALNLSF